jgi:mannose-1-phosphate guanylyltransferase
MMSRRGDIDPYELPKVARFVEKPSASVARSLVKAGGLWNTMIMVFKVKTLLQLVQKIDPSMHQHFTRVFDAIGTYVEPNIVDEVYRNLEPLNFSKGILEKISVIYPEAMSVLPVRKVFWSDWGSPERVIQVQERLGSHASRTRPKLTLAKIPEWRRELAK